MNELVDLEILLYKSWVNDKVYNMLLSANGLSFVLPSQWQGRVIKRNILIKNNYTYCMSVNYITVDHSGLCLLKYHWIFCSVFCISIYCEILDAIFYMCIYITHHVAFNVQFALISLIFSMWYNCSPASVINCTLTSIDFVCPCKGSYTYLTFHHIFFFSSWIYHLCKYIFNEE